MNEVGLEDRLRLGWREWDDDVYRVAVSRVTDDDPDLAENVECYRYWQAHGSWRDENGVPE